MTKLKDILKDRICETCGNSKPENFVLYSVLENGQTKTYISCVDCGELTEVDIKKRKTEDYLLVPHVGMGG